MTDSTPTTATTMPDQRSLYDQVSDLWRFARQQKMYDAQDWLATHWQGHPLPCPPTPEVSQRARMLADIDAADEDD